MLKLKDTFIKSDISCANCNNLNAENYCTEKKQFVLIPILSTCRDRDLKKSNEICTDEEESKDT